MRDLFDDDALGAHAGVAPGPGAHEIGAQALVRLLGQGHRGAEEAIARSQAPGHVHRRRADERALHHLFAEILDNSMDEAVQGHAKVIEVALEASGALSVR